MLINGKWYSETEISAMISQLIADKNRLDGEIHRLTEKLEEVGTDYNNMVDTCGFLESENKGYAELLHKVQPVLRAAFFAHYEQTNNANELYDKITEFVGKE